MAGAFSPTRLERATGIASMAAGLVHGALAHEHFKEWWGYGYLFLAAMTAQILLGLALLVSPFEPGLPAARVARMRKGLLWAGVAANVCLILLYALTRTVGIPLFGPDAGEVESVAPIDLVTKAVEFGVIAGLVALLLRTSAATSADSAV